MTSVPARKVTAEETLTVDIRHYYAIWKQIRNRNRCILEIRPADLRRFKKAISKEKARDLAWNASNKKKLVFTETTDRQDKYCLIVTLQIYVGVKGLVSIL